MFDYFEPKPALACPKCGVVLSGWQGKDGPSALLVWQQGSRHPVDQRAGESNLTSEERSRFELPDRFAIYTRCCHELWSRTRLVRAEDVDLFYYSETKSQRRARRGWLAHEELRTTTLYRPVGPAELVLIAASGWKEFPARLPEQPIFYPVLSEEYAAQIAERWNVPESGGGYVMAFDVDADYLAKFEVKQVGGSEHRELWVPAGEMTTFNQHIVGVIRVVRECRGTG